MAGVVLGSTDLPQTLNRVVSDAPPEKRTRTKPSALGVNFFCALQIPWQYGSHVQCVAASINWESFIWVSL